MDCSCLPPRGRRSELLLMLVSTTWEQLMNSREKKAKQSKAKYNNKIHARSVVGRWADQIAGKVSAFLSSQIIVFFHPKQAITLWSVGRQVHVFNKHWLSTYVLGAKDQWNLMVWKCAISKSISRTMWGAKNKVTWLNKGWLRQRLTYVEASEIKAQNERYELVEWKWMVTKRSHSFAITIRNSRRVLLQRGRCPRG